MEKELALEFLDILRQNNVHTVKLYRLIAEIEIIVIKHLKNDHVHKTSLATALKINRTTLQEKLKRYKITF